MRSPETWCMVQLKKLELFPRTSVTPLHLNTVHVHAEGKSVRKEFGRDSTSVHTLEIDRQYQERFEAPVWSSDVSKHSQIRGS